MKALSGLSLLIAAGLCAQDEPTTPPKAQVETWLRDLGSADAARSEAASTALLPHLAALAGQVEPLLADSEARRRIAAARLFLTAKVAPSAPALRPLLHDPDDTVRETGVLLYARLRPAGWIDELSLLLAHEREPRVLRQALVGLGGSGDLQVAPALVDWLALQQDDYLLDKGHAALRSLTGVDHGRDVAKWRSWWDQVGRARLAEQQRARETGETAEAQPRPVARPRTPILPKRDAK
jgi:hypothetical protein